MSDQPEVNVPQIPVDLTLSSTEDLTALEAAATEYYAALAASDDVSAEALQAIQRYTEDIERLRAELKVRKQRDEEAALREQTRLADEKARLTARVLPPADPIDEPETVPALTAEDIAVASARGVTAALVSALNDNGGGDINKRLERATASLADASRFAPQVQAPKPVNAVTASVDIPGVERGSDVPTVEAVCEILSRQANSMQTTHGNPNYQHAVTVRNTFAHTVDSRTKPQEIGELLRHMVNNDTKQDMLEKSLVAAGGWCAPSEIKYDFFNAECFDGGIDLPTVGVSRGGIQFPVSASMADVFSATFTNATNPWLWTEDDDILAATGSPTKPCVRVPCPEFVERRLECYGLCITQGNLTDDAYPESTAHYIRLLMSAHAHATNARIIATMASLSAAVVTGGFFAGDGPAYNAILSSISLAAVDYRARYGMCSDDILEVVIPQWVLEVIQADLSLRTGSADVISVTKDQVRRYFADRGIRPQFVGDWQVRDTGLPGVAAGLTAWPTTVDIMIYAAGTFIKGNGLSLNLGVVRDSTLNETNDHTALWMEDCHLVGMVGNESRRYRIAFDISGDLCCPTA